MLPDHVTMQEKLQNNVRQFSPITNTSAGQLHQTHLIYTFYTQHGEQGQTVMTAYNLQGPPLAHFQG